MSEHENVGERMSALEVAVQGLTERVQALEADIVGGKPCGYDDPFRNDSEGSEAEAESPLERMQELD